jgi:hypothetical protein
MVCISLIAAANDVEIGFPRGPEVPALGQGGKCEPHAAAKDGKRANAAISSSP